MQWSVEIHLVRPDGTNANLRKEFYEDFDAAVDAFSDACETLNKEE